MKHKVWTSLLVSFIILGSACNVQARSLEQSEAVLTPASTATAEAAPTATTPAATSTITATPVPTASTWLTYTSALSVSIEYPADWVVEETPHGSVYFQPADSSGAVLEEGISVDIANVPVEEQESIDPNSAVPNEGGFEVNWGTPITVDGAGGWMYVWANYDSNPDQSAYLMAVIYSEQQETAVTINGGYFDDESKELVEQTDLADVVAERFPAFDHMVKSVRFIATEAESDNVGSAATPLKLFVSPVLN